MPDETTAISVKNLTKSFNGRRVLDGINLNIRRGEIFVIMGGSGCGKSTLLRHMTGAVRPDSGCVLFNGQDLTRIPERELEKVKRRFGMSFQSAALLDFLSVQDNVSLPLREHTKLTKKIIHVIVKMKLGLVGMQGFENMMPNELSGGMRKRVGLARAIAMDPEIVFYDEPSAGLDPIACAVVDRLIMDLSRKLLLTSVVVTHNMDSVFRIADRVGMLYKGQLLEVGTSEQIKRSGNPVVQQFIRGELEGPIDIRADEDTAAGHAL